MGFSSEHRLAEPFVFILKLLTLHLVAANPIQCPLQRLNSLLQG